MAVAVPVIDTPEHVKAAQAATRALNAGFTTVMLEGKYTDAYLAEVQRADSAERRLRPRLVGSDIAR
jgi:beta-glucosidase